MRKMVKRKLFLQIQDSNIVYSNVENMIVMPITKKKEIVMSIHICHTSRMNFDYIENGGKKAFLANPKHQYRTSQCTEDDCSANSKMNGDYSNYPSLSHFSSEL